MAELSRSYSVHVGHPGFKFMTICFPGRHSEYSSKSQNNMVDIFNKFTGSGLR